MLEASFSLPSKLPGIEQSIFSVMSALAAEHNAINLAQGFPDFDCDPVLIELVHKYMLEGKNQYAPSPGILSLREKISAKVESLYGNQYDPVSEVTITGGATQALYMAITAIVKEKDEVIIFEPAYDSYLPAILINKGAPKYIKLEEPNFEIDWNQVKKSITSRTKMIIINTPHNPSGRVWTEDDMKQLEKLVSGRDIVVLSDEVYEHIIYDGRQHQSVCRFPVLAAQSLIVSSFGKTYHTTGWKMGYVLGPKELTDEFRKVYAYGMFSANTPIQYAYSDILTESERYRELSSFYQAKRDLFLEATQGSRFSFGPCEGSYFICGNFKEISDMADKSFAEWMTIEKGVAAIPVSAFFHDKYDTGMVRFCFAKNNETLLRAAEKLCKI